MKSRSTKALEVYDSVAIRAIRLVVDTEDIFAPHVDEDEFLKLRGAPPEAPRQKLVSIEVVTCPEDDQPTTLAECGRCPKFIRRYDGRIYHRT